MFPAAKETRTIFVAPQSEVFFKMLRRFPVLFLLVLFWGVPLAAQFQQFPVQSRASCHLLDGDTLWVGTENGFFKMLRSGQLLGRWAMPNPAIPDAAPRALALDSAGHLLAYFDFWGIRRFDGTAWEVVSEPLTPTIGNLSFLSIATDTQGRILLSGSRLFRQNGSDWQQVSPPGVEVNKMLRGAGDTCFFVGKNKIVRWDGVAGWDSSDVYLPDKQYLFDICLDAAGDLFGVFYAQGAFVPEVWKFPGGDLSSPQLVATATGFGYNSNPEIRFAKSICVDALGRVLLNINGPDFHFIRWDGAVWTKIGGDVNGPFGPNQYEEANLAADPDGSVWLSQATKDQPLFRLTDDGKFQPFGQSLTLQDGVAAPDGKIWCSGSRFVTCFDPADQSFRQFFPKNGATQFWHSIGVSPADGAVYAGDKTQIWKFDGQAWSLFHNFGTGKLTDRILVSKDNWVWATVDVSGGNDLLFGKNAASGATLSFPAQNSNNFSDLAIAPDTSVWVAHRNQIFRYKNGVFTYFTAANTGFPFDVANATTAKMSFDGQGNLWAFFNNVGLVKFDGAAWTAFMPQNSGLLTDGSLYDMEVDAGGQVWLSFNNFSNPAESGLQFFNGNFWETFTATNSNMAGPPVYNIMPSSDGKVWFNAPNRLFSIQFLSRWLRGTLRRDDNADCLPEAPEPPLNQWIVQATDLADGEKFYARSHTDGGYEFNLDSAVYQISLIPPAPIWDDCGGSATVNLTQTVEDSLDFSGEAVADCPLLNLDVSVPFLRRCYASNYVVNICNLGTAAAFSTAVSLFLPPELTLLGMGLPFNSPAPGHFVVPIGTVAQGECGSFSVSVLPDCDAELGSTICLSAQISPDSFCFDLPNWSGADLHATARCANDTAFFTIKNLGTGGMGQPLEYIVIEDEVIMREGPVLLPAGDSLVVPFPATTSFQRIQLPQEPGHPFFGLVSASVEGCGAVDNGWFFTGYPFEDPSPFAERTCAEVVGSFDPNDKAALPQGVGNQHFIFPGTELDYKIRFQNTGTDTAFLVVVRDTLSPFLDVSTLRVGAASHPFEWEISGSGILTFRFEDILLPDSNVNEAASHGFLQFSLKPFDTLPLPTVIENRAGIYFDFNAPVITNTVFHTLDTGFLQRNLPDGLAEKTAFPGVIVFPNPARETAFISLKNSALRHSQHMKIRVRDPLGRPILEQQFNGRNIEIRRGRQQSGVCFLEILDENGAVVAAGKLIWK